VASYSCPKSILLSYEREKRRQVQEDKGIFKHEATSNVDYNQDIVMEYEGMEQDKSDAIKMMALHESDVSDNTWNLPSGLIMIGESLTSQEEPTCEKMLKCF
jgi:hypothetical protein